MTFHIDRFFALFFLSLPLFSQAGERFSAREAIPEADTISFGDKGPVSIAQDDSLMLRQIFDSDTFEGISEIDMAAPDILAVPDSVIQHRLKVLDARSPLSLEFNPEVRAYINLYLGQRRELVARLVGLSMYYYEIFESILDRYEIPLELKHLTIVESALNPKARSRAGATGLWQFMYSTGKM